MTGYELIQQIHKHSHLHVTPIIVLTGLLTDTTVGDGRERQRALPLEACRHEGTRVEALHQHGRYRTRVQVHDNYS